MAKCQTCTRCTKVFEPWIIAQTWCRECLDWSMDHVACLSGLSELRSEIALVRDQKKSLEGMVDDLQAKIEDEMEGFQHPDDSWCDTTFTALGRFGAWDCPTEEMAREALREQIAKLRPAEGSRPTIPQASELLCELGIWHTFVPKGEAVRTDLIHLHGSAFIQGERSRLFLGLGGDGPGETFETIAALRRRLTALKKEGRI